ncbi:MAG: flagellar hook-length control protein FliK [Phycisphaerales bacterium]|nr:flagellar hook-length control protein FliK [Phycisphaerales bacterium]
MVQLAVPTAASVPDVMQAIAPLRERTTPSAQSTPSFAQQLQDQRAEAAPSKQAPPSDPPQATQSSRSDEQVQPAPAERDELRETQPSESDHNHEAESEEPTPSSDAHQSNGSEQAAPKEAETTAPEQEAAAAPIAEAILAVAIQSTGASTATPASDETSETSTSSQPDATRSTQPAPEAKVVPSSVKATSPASAPDAHAASQDSNVTQNTAAGADGPSGDAPVDSSANEQSSQADEPAQRAQQFRAEFRQDGTAQSKPQWLHAEPVQQVNAAPAESQQQARPEPRRASTTPTTVEHVDASVPAQSSAPVPATDPGAQTLNLQNIAPRLTPAPTTPQAPTEAEAQAFQAAASRGLSAALRQSGGTVTLRLVPETLGALRVNLQINGSTVALHLETGGGRAHEMLTQHIASLRAGLEHRGLKVEEVTTRIAPELARPVESNAQSQHGQSTTREREGDTSQSWRQPSQDRQQPREEQRDPSGDPGQDASDGHHANEDEQAFAQLRNVMLRLNAVA